MLVDFVTKQSTSTMVYSFTVHNGTKDVSNVVHWPKLVVNVSYPIHLHLPIFIILDVPSARDVPTSISSMEDQKYTLSTPT